MTIRQIFDRSLASCAVFVAVVLLAGVAPAGASIVTYYGADNGAGPVSARPTSNAAAAAFDLAVGGSPPIITFEDLPVGYDSNFSPVTGVTVTIANRDSAGGCGDICGTDQHTAPDGPYGYNTTTGGTKHLRIRPFFDSASGETVTFSFTNPISAFGAYLTDTETGFPGPITLTFDDGAVQILNITKTNPAGALFFGFRDTEGLITSVSFNTGSTVVDPNGRDLWGIDDVRYVGPAVVAVPEPTTLALLGLCLAGLAASRRRR